MKILMKINFLLLLVAVLISCEEGDHLITSPPPANSVNMNNYDYLASQPDNFGELIKVIDRTSLVDSIKRDDVTFFALQNESILTYLGSQDYTSVEDAPVDSLSKLLLKYVIDGKMLRSDFNTGLGDDFETPSTKLMNVKIVVGEYKGVQNVGAYNIVYSDTELAAGLRALKLSTLPAEALVTTGDIQTTNGVVHIIEKTHKFGF